MWVGIKCDSSSTCFLQALSVLAFQLQHFILLRYSVADMLISFLYALATSWAKLSWSIPDVIIH